MNFLVRHLLKLFVILLNLSHEKIKKCRTDVEWKFVLEQNSNLLKRHSTEVNMHVQINIVERFSISIWTRHSWPEWDKHRKVRWNTRGKLLSYILYLFSCRTWSFLWYTSFFKVDISEIVFLLQRYTTLKLSDILLIAT